MSVIEKLESFDDTIEDINIYLLRPKHYIKDNAI